ncbi:MAG: radical SAM/SPASM domain-containing protein [Candidatus Xenobiia bacterium LiM19]
MDIAMQGKMKIKPILSDNRIIPQNVIVETIFGCNSSCIMCPINMPTDRSKGLMDENTFKAAIDGLARYADLIAQIDLFGVGEPFLDVNIDNRVRYAKKRGFRDVGFATNADLMTVELAERVFEAGLDTIMISLDGMTREVHESIRLNTSFPRIVSNVKSAIALRDKNCYKTKFVMRFIRQPKNLHEWDSYREYWTPFLSREKGDLIIGYDMHTWGGEISIDKSPDWSSVPDGLACHHLFDRLIILNDGSVPVCCSDMHSGRSILGNIKDSDPVEVFNNSRMQKMRDMHLSGNRLQIEMCRACTILESESNRQVE